MWRSLCVGLLAAGVVGCSGKPSAIRTAKKVEETPAAVTVELLKGSPPEKSDPASAAVIRAAVAAHTGGKPELLEKLRSVKWTRSGTWVASQPTMAVTWEVRAVWPDRYRADAELHGRPRMTLSRQGNRVWRSIQIVGAGKEELTEPNLREAIADATYEPLAVLIPLADADLIAAPAAARTLNGRPATGVWLSGKNLPRAVAHFDDETKRLAQFTYEGFESGRATVKEVVVLSTRETNGVTFPDKLVVKWDGRTTVEWNESGVEFPVDLPGKLFEEP